MKTYAVTRDAIELDTVYQAIDKEELEQKIAQYYCDCYCYRKGKVKEEMYKIQMGNQLNPTSEEYWEAKQNVLFEQYGVMWYSPAELNDKTYIDNLCEYKPNIWAYVRLKFLFNPVDCKLLLPWTNVKVTLSHTTHDFSGNNSYSESKLIPRKNVQEGSNLILFFDSFYYAWGRIMVDNVDNESLSGWYLEGDFSITSKQGFWSEDYGVAPYTTGSIGLELVAEKEPAIPLGCDNRKLIVSCYKRVAIDVFELVESLTLPLDGMPDNYIPYEIGEEYTDAVLKRIVCKSRNSAGMSGQIELVKGDIRNFLFKTGEYYRYFFSDVYVKVLLTDDTGKATNLADAEFCRYCMEVIPAKTDNNTVRRLAQTSNRVRVDAYHMMEE